MRLSTTPDGPSSAALDLPLGDQEFAALSEACKPVGMAGFPPAMIIHALRKQGYISIVLGGIQITERGLERLLRERARSPARDPMRRDLTAVGRNRDQR